METSGPPAFDCALCPRLAASRQFALPRPSLGPIDAELLIVSGTADSQAIETRQRTADAVRCPTPAGLPLPREIATCNAFLAAELAEMTRLRGVVAIGAVAHHAVLAACGITPGRFRFRAGRIHQLPDGLLLADTAPAEQIDATMLALRQRITR